MRRTGPFAEVGLLTRRLVVETVRRPAVVIPNLAVSVFFLVVYDGVLGGSDAVRNLTGGNYLNFILPVAGLSASVAGSTAGLALVADVQSGYFRRLLAMPLRRSSIVVAAMLLGAVQVLAQTVVILLLALLLGADPATGVPGMVAFSGIAFIWGLAFAAYSIAVALRTGDAQSTQAAALLFLPLIFFTPVFLPEDQLQEWVREASTYNPTTYVLLGMRSLVVDGWEVRELLKAIAAGTAFAAVTMTWAIAVARKTTRRA